MSGFGERFRRAGYSLPKPLIEIDGKPIIAHVIEMFPGEENFIFICNQDHLDNPEYKMEETLKRYCPSGKIIGIAAHKLGPIHAVRQAEHLLDPTQPVIINYCDFTCYWNWPHFKSFVADSQCAGAIPAYKGFHPHTLGSTNYAYMREQNGWVLDIQEKQPYTSNRMEEFASSGTYYFASGALMKQALRDTMDQDLNIAGEYYVSLAYKPMLFAQLPIAVYPLQHFMQWGTPQDLAEYLGWSKAFRQLLDHGPHDRHPRPAQGALIVPMAGMGQRFVNEGYVQAKPLIEVSGKPMVIQASDDLPLAQQHAFVLRSDMAGYQSITQTLQDAYPGAVIETIDKVTEGQACSALLGLEAMERALGAVTGTLTFGTCDNGVLYDEEALQKLLDDEKIDVIVWAVRGNANAVRRPEMFGWIEEEQGKIRSISVKIPLASPESDPIVMGMFTFRKAENFHRVVKSLVDRNGRINGEFYLDSCINDALQMGLHCHMFEVDSYLSWGTPNDLRTFEYWQSCFHKWRGHPYALQLDRRLAASALASLESRYQAWQPQLPGAHA